MTGQPSLPAQETFVPRPITPFCDMETASSPRAFSNFDAKAGFDRFMTPQSAALAIEHCFWAGDGASAAFLFYRCFAKQTARPLDERLPYEEALFDSADAMFPEAVDRDDMAFLEPVSFLVAFFSPLNSTREQRAMSFWRQAATQELEHPFHAMKHQAAQKEALHDMLAGLGRRYAEAAHDPRWTNTEKNERMKALITSTVNRVLLLNGLPKLPQKGRFYPPACIKKPLGL